MSVEKTWLCLLWFQEVILLNGYKQRSAVVEFYAPIATEKLQLKKGVGSNVESDCLILPNQLVERSNRSGVTKPKPCAGFFIFE
jgi:hypothetical protein